jgi:U3 small nucleolar RNA-associated protein 5
MPSAKEKKRKSVATPTFSPADELTSLSAFSPSGAFFAFLSLAVDRHRLRIYDSSSAVSVAEYVQDNGRVTALSWGVFDGLLSPAQPASDEPPNKRRRKKSISKIVDGPSSQEVVLLGLCNGSIVFVSPSHGQVVKTLSHPNSSSRISSIAALPGSENVWEAQEDGLLSLWNAADESLKGSWKLTDRKPQSAIAINPAAGTDEAEILVANHSISLFSVSSPSDSSAQKPRSLATFPGHASAIKSLQWDVSQTPNTRFISLAERDRVLSVWEVPKGSEGGQEGRMVASIQLDSDARSITLLYSSVTQKSTGQSVLALSASGKVYILPVPAELVPPASSKRTHHEIPSLLPRSIFVRLSGPPVVAASFVQGSEGKVRIARISGLRPVFDILVSVP